MKNYNEIENAFEKIGVCLKDSDGNFRMWYDIFEEVAEKWNKNIKNNDKTLRYRNELIKTFKDKVKNNEVNVVETPVFDIDPDALT